MRRIAPVLALALVTSLAVGGVALATPSTKTTFAMDDQGPYVEYSGKVTSSSGRCVADRAVKIFHAGVLIAQTTTNANGTWSVIGPKPPDGDNVTVKVKPKKRDGVVLCKGTSVTKAFQAD